MRSKSKNLHIWERLRFHSIALHPVLPTLTYNRNLTKLLYSWRLRVKSIYYFTFILVNWIHFESLKNFQINLEYEFQVGNTEGNDNVMYIFCDNIQTLFSYSSISWHGDRSPLVPTMMLGSLWIFNIWYQWHFNLSLKDILFRCTEKRFAYSVQNINRPFWNWF